MKYNLWMDTMTTIKLPSKDGSLNPYILSGKTIAPAEKTQFNRIAFAAVHVVANPFSSGDPSSTVSIDWERTLAFRRYLGSMGFSIAEAMDTAQRGMGLDWKNALELIQQTVREVKGVPVFSGVGTDHLAAKDVRNLDDVVDAYLHQLEAVQSVGGQVIVMASRALTWIARDTDDYLQVYSKVLQNCDQPIIIHWLGDMFDPTLTGYWGSNDFKVSSEACLQVIQENKSKVDGMKISLLDKDYEIDLRRRLPEGVRMYTGDDFNFAELIAGDEQGYSDALLGIFDPIAPAASAALAALTEGDSAKFHEILAPTVPLSRLIFSAPTQFYKTGVVFLGWLNGHQDHLVMLGGQQSMRSLTYFTEVFQLADQAGLLLDPELATSRMTQLLTLYGLEP